MALSEAGTVVAECPIADSAAPGTQLAQAISNRATLYVGPIETPVGKALWAIQAWYAESGDEVRTEALLVGGLTPQQWADCVPADPAFRQPASHR